MSLFDRLFKKDDIFTDYANNMQPLQPVQDELSMIQLEGGPQAGQAVPQTKPTFRQRVENARGVIADALLGKRANPTDNIDTSGDTINATVSNNPRVGGLFNDIMGGARENYSTGFAANNWDDDYTPDGRRKGLAYRGGELLGTLGRFGESSLGRGLITAGLVGATGGNPLQMLAYGGQAGTLNQKLRYQDKMYRNEMINNAQNSLQNSPEFMMLSDEEKQEALNNIANQVNSMRGYVTDDIYKNFVTAQQLRDNADYRNLMANLQMQNNQALQDFRKDQAEYQKQKDIADRADRAATRALTMRGQDLNYALGMGRLQAEAQKADSKQSASQKDAMSTLNQISLIRDMVKKNPRATGLDKGFLTGDLLNRFDNKRGNIETRTAIDALRTKIRHDLTGAQFSPKEAREYEKFLPNVRDSKEIINAKLNALEKRYYADFGVSLTGDTNNNPLGLNL